jgi:hypothetical protein
LHYNEIIYLSGTAGTVLEPFHTIHPHNVPAWTLSAELEELGLPNVDNAMLFTLITFSR